MAELSSEKEHHFFALLTPEKKNLFGQLLARSSRVKTSGNREALLVEIDYRGYPKSPENDTPLDFSLILIDRLMQSGAEYAFKKLFEIVNRELGRDHKSELSQIAESLGISIIQPVSVQQAKEKGSFHDKAKPVRSLLVVNGLSLDKKKIKDILSQIAVDNDLAELKARSSEYFANGEAVCRFLSQYSGQFNIRPSRDGFHFDADRDLKGQTREVQQAIPRLLAEPKREFEASNFSVWSPFLSNLSDAQVLLLGTTFQGERPVNYFFCAEPYYRVRFIDSLVLRLNIEQESIRQLWEKTRDDVAKSLAAKFLVENLDLPVKDAFEPFASGFGYGIFSLSRFFKELTSLSKGKLSVGFKVEGEEQFFARECIELATDPDEISFVDDISKSDITITALFESEKHRRPDDDELLVPIKRPLALPKDLMRGIIKPEAYLPHSDSVAIGEKASILFVGGAEHNLPLLHVVNRLRWEKKYRIGIAENKFCTVGSHKFLIGGENFVYGIGPAGRQGMAGFMTRERLASSRQNCEILSFRVPSEKSTEFQAFCVYGYSAVMTRIATAILAEALEGRETLRKFLPLDEEEPGELGNFLYSFKDAQREEKWKEFLQLWDARDLLNKTALSDKDVEFLSEHIIRKKTTSA